MSPEPQLGENWAPAAPVGPAVNPGHPFQQFAGSAPVPADAAYQERILPHVSRTFALTIPQLPAPLRVPVTTAYLLCRIADTIEDEPAIDAEHSYELLARFTDVVHGASGASELAADVAARLSARTLPAECDLVRNLDRVIRVLRCFPESQQGAIRRCVRVMSWGMHHFQLSASPQGLARRADLDSYCYYVAGVVGEMLTELFATYSPVMYARRERMLALAASFGQGLQMTNILKDVWEDRARGACWLPQEVFTPLGVELGGLRSGEVPASFGAGMSELVGIAHGHLRNALEYTLLIPPAETGIRRFCLWAVGLAVLTLQRIRRRPGFSAGREVKVSRRAVMATRLLTNAAVRRDAWLRALFAAAARGLPLAPPAGVRDAAWAASMSHREIRPRSAQAQEGRGAM